MPLSPIERAQQPLADPYLNHAARSLVDVLRRLPAADRAGLVTALGEQADEASGSPLGPVWNALCVLVDEVSTEELRVLGDAGVA